MINKEERNDERKQKILQEVDKLLTGLPMGLDTKNREAFNSKFNVLKGFLFELNI